MTLHAFHLSRTACAMLVAALVPTGAQAAVFTVGASGTGCTHSTIQAAINAANSSAGADTVRIARSLTWSAQAITINTGQELLVEGGYATCTAAADNTNTTVSGAGGAAAPVFTIEAPTGALIRLRRLNIRDGDVAGAGTGGGIRFSGDGILEISDSAVLYNSAGYGGGIHARGSGSNAELVIGANVSINNNLARYDGGGVFSDQIETSMTAPGSAIFFNEATGLSANTGYGGGLYIVAGALNSYAYIGSGSAFGAIFGNRAVFGGGVAIGGQGPTGSARFAELRLFGNDAAVRARINSNTATMAGGGIHARAAGGTVHTYAQLWNASLESNAAPAGAAVYLGNGGGGSLARFSLNTFGWPAGAVPCASGRDCGEIASNIAIGTAPVPNGAALHAENGTDMYLGVVTTLARGGIVLRNNTGRHLINSGSGQVLMDNVLIHANQVDSDLITKSGGALTLRDATIAGNSIGGGGAVMRAVGTATTLLRSILWQPGNAVLSRSGGSLSHSYLDASDTGSFGGAVASYNPRFVDPDRADFRLRAGSTAIDVAPALPDADRDVFGELRDVDLPARLNGGGTRDIGAFERQSLQPMVLNADFDPNDLRLWTPVTAGITTRDAAQNVTGATGSGSARVSTSGLSVGADALGIAQCIHLPGPALYALNGWGRGTGSMVIAGDRAILRWEYRRNGGENCTGTLDAFGTLTLSAGAWNRPATPALIDISPANWGASPSIRVVLVAQEFGAGSSTNAWFDGITLDATVDRLFSHGFEN